MSIPWWRQAGRYDAGDVVLTPSWCGHGHADVGSETAFWLDFLDVPFVRHVDATFFEPHPDAFQRPTERDPAFRIPLATVLAGRTGMHSVEIAKDVMPTIGLHAIRLPSGAATEKLHETANNIYAVVTGTVRATIGGQADEFLARGDVLAVQRSMATFFAASRTRPCCGSPTNRS